MGAYHAAKLAVSPEVEFIACHDIVTQKAEKIASEYNCRVFGSIADFIGEVDAVLIAVPTQNHLDCSLPFLANGIAVLLEKPIAPDIDSAEQIVKTAEDNRAILQIGHSERFNAVYRTARGKIKNPRFIETHRLAPFKGRGHDVDVVLDLMIHDIDLILDLTESEPDSIQAAGVAVITDSFDIVNARLSFPTGCVVNVTSSRISVKGMRKLRVFQKSGYLSMDLAAASLESYILTENDSPEAQKAGPFSRIQLPDGRLIIRQNNEIAAEDSLQNELDSFIESVKGIHPPVVSGEDGLLALKVACRIEEICREFQKNI